MPSRAPGSRRIGLILAGALLIAGGASTNALAQGSDPVMPVATGAATAAAEAVAPELGSAAAEPSGSSWEFSATPYVWFSGMSGDVGVPAIQPVEVDLSFVDVFDHLKFAAMVVFQARKDRFVALADIGYIDLGADDDIGIRDPEFVQVEFDTSNFYSTLAAGYRAVDHGAITLDLLAGIRISAVETRLELTGPLNTVVGEGSKTWVDPVVAARLHVPLAERWALDFYGDVGGFGVSSDITWQLLGTIQYRLGRSWWLTAGWRQYAIDYENDGFVYDVSMGGPIVGVGFRF